MSASSSSSNVRVALLQTASMSRFTLSSSAPSAKEVYQRVQKQLESDLRPVLDSPRPPKLLVLPEMFAQPYSAEYFPHFAMRLPDVGSKGPFEFPLLDYLSQVARRNSLYLVGGSLSELDPQGNSRRDGRPVVYNTTLVFDPEGKVCAKHRKIHLFDVAVPNGINFRESDTLTPGNRITMFSTPFGKVGLSICYDIRFPELFELMRQKGADIIISPGAFNSTTGPAHWELLHRARAVDNQVYVIACSPAKAASGTGEDGKGNYPAHGRSMVINPWGKIVSTVDHDRPGFIVTDIDMAMVKSFRQQIPTSSQKRRDIYQVQDRTTQPSVGSD